jgi:predicted Zn-dependent protease
MPNPKLPLRRRPAGATLTAPSAWTVALVLLAGALVTTSGCATSGVNKGDVNLLSYQEEWQLGERLSKDLAGKLDLVQNRAALNYVNRVGQSLVARTELRNLPWTFHIVNDPEVNAFNIPGGHVYVNTGLIAAAGDVAEFSGVMSHEIGHGVARHGTEQLTRAYGLQLVAGLVLGEDPPVYQQILAQIAGTGAMAKFSRDAESEADRLGVRYMAGAGYDPEGMADMFRVLLQRRESRPGSVGQFFSTHPLTEDRIRNVEALAARIDRSGLTRHDRGYQRLRNRFAD